MIAKRGEKQQQLTIRKTLLFLDILLLYRLRMYYIFVLKHLYISRDSNTFWFCQFSRKFYIVVLSTFEKIIFLFEDWFAKIESFFSIDKRENARCTLFQMTCLFWPNRIFSTNPADLLHYKKATAKIIMRRNSCDVFILNYILHLWPKKSKYQFFRLMLPWTEFQLKNELNTALIW